MTVPDQRPLATMECVVQDCPDPGELAAFYRSLLGDTINQPDLRLPPDREGTLQVGRMDTRPYPEGDGVPADQAGWQQVADEGAQARDLQHHQGMRVAVTRPCAVWQSRW